MASTGAPISGVGFRAFVAASALAGTTVAHGGFYFSGELGANAGEDMLLRSGDTDRASRCDEFVNPLYADLEGCTSPDHSSGAVDDWMSDFDGGWGWHGAIAGGYAIQQRWRVELEWLRRRFDADQSSSILSPEGVAFTQVFGTELPEASERLGTLATDNLFANVYFEWPNNSRLTPYVGAGVGIGRASMDYAALWRRSSDPATVESARGLPNEAEVRRNLAGTVSAAGKRLRDELRGWQLLAGVRYRLGDSMSLALHGRWTRLSTFTDGGSYAQLRSHVSNLRRDGSEPVTYRVSTNDNNFAAIGLRFTVRL